MILLNDREGLMSTVEHKSRIMNGNENLLRFFRNLGKCHKAEMKEKVADLYKHMANPKHAVERNIEELAHHLKHLKWVAKVTQNANLNEFLGTFDKLCEVMYYSG